MALLARDSATEASIMKLDLSLNQLLRYAFAGGIALFVNRVICVSVPHLLSSNPTASQLSLIAGINSDTRLHDLHAAPFIHLSMHTASDSFAVGQMHPSYTI